MCLFGQLTLYLLQLLGRSGRLVLHKSEGLRTYRGWGSKHLPGAEAEPEEDTSIHNTENNIMKYTYRGRWKHGRISPKAGWSWGHRTGLIAAWLSLWLRHWRARWLRHSRSLWLWHGGLLWLWHRRLCRWWQGGWCDADGDGGRLGGVDAGIRWRHRRSRWAGGHGGWRGHGRRSTPLMHYGHIVCGFLRKHKNTSKAPSYAYLASRTSACSQACIPKIVVWSWFWIK